MKNTLLLIVTLSISLPIFGMLQDLGNDYGALLAQATELVHDRRNTRALRITHAQARQWLINSGILHPDDSESEETSHKRARVHDEISDD